MLAVSHIKRACHYRFQDSIYPPHLSAICHGWAVLIKPTSMASPFDRSTAAKILRINSQCQEEWVACSGGLEAMRHWHAAMRAEPCRRSFGTGPACECLSTGHGTGKPSSTDNRGTTAGTKTSRG